MLLIFYRMRNKNTDAVCATSIFAFGFHGRCCQLFQLPSEILSITITPEIYVYS
jgi:hypothetical protein